MSNAHYNESHVQVLPGLAAVRKRPGMYIGNTDVEGLHHLIYEIIDNSVDESFAKICDTISVALIGDGVVQVTDNGRGIPIRKHASNGRPTVETVMTILHAGAKFESGAYKISGGLHGVGLSVVNALSKWIEVEVHRDGVIWQIRCEGGVPVEWSRLDSQLTIEELETFFDPVYETSTIRKIGTTTRTGTTVTFLPDFSLFEVDKYSPTRIKNRLEELSYLVPGVQFVFADVGTEPVSYRSDNGIDDLLRKLSPESRGNLAQFNLVDGGDSMNVALAFNTTGHEKIASYANGINTPDGGTHVTTFRTAFSRAAAMFAKDHMLKVSDGALDELKGDITAVVEVRLGNPQFESQTKVKLKNSEIQKKFLKDLITAIKFELETQSVLFEELIREASAISAKRAKFKDDLAQMKKKRQKLERSLPAKLSDCTSKRFEERELFIVEGDSAGGSLKQGKEDATQACLPLRGKTLNVEKADLEDRVMKNESLVSIATAIGLDLENPDYKNLRYSRVIIMTDADADGSHITCLLISFFYTYFRELIARGHLYVALPPLYRARVGKNYKYLLDEKELDQYLAAQSDRDRERVVIQRFKGLGEMNPEQLFETCVDPKNRRMLQVTVPDAEEARRVLDITLGMSADLRKDFIREHAAEVDESFFMEGC